MAGNYAYTLALLGDILHKLVITGFRSTVAGYMTPERRYEAPLFEVLARHGFTTSGFLSWGDEMMYRVWKHRQRTQARKKA